MTAIRVEWVEMPTGRDEVIVEHGEDERVVGVEMIDNDTSLLHLNVYIARDGDPLSGRTVFEWLVEYLTLRGWHRDGDDPGLWLRPGARYSDALPLGLSVQTQLELDGVRMTEIP